MTTATKVQLNRNDLLELYTELGWKSTAKWDNKKCLKNLAAIKDVIDSTKTYSEKASQLMVDIAAGQESNAEFEILGDDSGATASATTATVGTKGMTDEEKAAVAKAKQDEKDRQKKLKEAEKAAEKKAKEDAKAAKSKKKDEEKQIAPGVKSRGRGYFAGIVIKKHGLEGGINENMAMEVDALYGNINTVVSMGALKWAHDAISGYLAEYATDTPAAPADAEKTA